MSINTPGTDMTSGDWGGDDNEEPWYPSDDQRDHAEEAANAAAVVEEQHEAFAPPTGRIVVLYTSGDDTVLRAALQTEDREKAVSYFDVFRQQGIHVQVISTAPSPR